MSGSVWHDGSNDELRETFARQGFITASDAMLPILRQALKAASASDVTILLEGETGTGKQVLAQAIHHLDPKRADFPFVTVHCGVIREALVESELFGHRRGAFTGAVAERPGLFQTANQGTLFRTKSTICTRGATKTS
jgi:transcriptional regulator with PAS, ATPase and Fis domain